jgi:thioredoxin-dependent peroxiredoxin
MIRIVFPGFLVLALLICNTTAARAENPSNFTVKSPLDGTKFELKENRDKMVVLHFLLKTECPYCLRYTHEYALLAAKTPGVVHVFLKPDADSEIKSWVSHLDSKDLKTLPTIYRDPDAKLAKQFQIPGGYQFHGQSVRYPALIVIDKTGKEAFRYVGKNNGDRMSVADFTKKLESLDNKK